MELDWSRIEAIILARVSDDRDGASESTYQQVDESREWCEDRGIPILETITEDDIGASRYSRKARDGYEYALTLLKAPSAKRRMLVTWESSRATRRLDVYVRFREICEESGALWCYGGRVYDMRNAEDRRRTAQDAIDDEYEVEKTRKRVMRDMRATTAAGRPHGKLAYGYRIIRDHKTGKSVDRIPDEDTAPIVREIARRILAKEPVRSVATDLNRRGIPAPRPARKGPNKGGPAPWRANTMAKLITSPTYAGLRVSQGVVVREATWPAIISMPDHERLKALLSDPARILHRGVEPVWLLTYIAMCGVCGGEIVRLASRGADMYTCQSKFCVARAVEYVDRLVVEAVLQRLESPDAMDLLLSNDASAAEAYKEAAELQSRLDGFIDEAAEGKVSSQALGRIEAKLRPQIVAANRRARSAISSPLVRKMAGPNAREGWKELTVPERRELVRVLIEVRIFRAPRGMRGSANPNFIHVHWHGSVEPVPTGPPEIPALADGGDPMNFTIGQVLEYLRGVDMVERRRVIAMERAGRARFKITRLSLDPARARTGPAEIGTDGSV